ncbi:hypothetical protein INR49_025505 [Caranx melampygus]|nr:hypothetical protein INR49_025505 [Caranx melampygus]
MGKTYQVMVHGVRGEKMIIDLCNTDEQFKSMSVLQLKEKIAARMPETAAPMNYHGLMNQGATCYLNSVLQVLFMTRDFREAVQRSMSEDPERIDHQLRDLFNDLDCYTAYTYNITKRLGIDRVFEQRDAAQYYEKILALTSDEASQIFHGELTHQTLCSIGHREKISDGKFWHLPLELVKSNSETYRVVDGIEDYFKESSFSGENQMYCDQCGDKSDATTKCELRDPPEVLTLLLKRFEFDYYYMMYIKNNCDVDVPCSLHIPESHMYELYAVVDHWGDLRSGHYTARIKSQDDERWYMFDDTRVRLLDPGPFQQNDTERSFSAYLLFYRKKKTHAADTCAHDMEVSTNDSLPDARVNKDHSEDADTGREREEDRTEDTADVVPVDRNGTTEPRDMISVECREPELPPKHICPVEHQDNATEARQRGQHSDQGRNQDSHTKKLESTGADHLTRARIHSPIYNYFCQGVQCSGSAGDHKHSMPEDDGGCKQGDSDMLYEGPEQQRRDVKGDNQQSEADDDAMSRRKKQSKMDSQSSRQYISRTDAPPAPMNYHGLKNQGATCYLNSVLQVLFMTRDFREAVQKFVTKSMDGDRDPEMYEQQDAAQYYEKILALTSDEASQIFHGELTNKTKCSTCDTEKSSDGKFWHLPLELVKSNSETYRVVDGIKEYFRELDFSGENQMYCDGCDDKSDATTKCELKDPPEVLTLLLKRFEFDYYYMRYIKNNCIVDVPCSLHIPECDHEPFQADKPNTSSSAYLLFYRKEKTLAPVSGGFLPAVGNNDDQCQDVGKKRKREDDEEPLKGGKERREDRGDVDDQEQQIDERKVMNADGEVGDTAVENRRAFTETQPEESREDQDREDSVRLDKPHEGLEAKHNASYNEERGKQEVGIMQPEQGFPHQVNVNMQGFEERKIMCVDTDKTGESEGDEQTDKERETLTKHPSRDEKNEFNGRLDIVKPYVSVGKREVRRR